MNVLVTGGTGFVGKKLGVKLVEGGHRVFLLVRDKSKKHVLPFPHSLVDWHDLNDITSNKKVEIHSVVNLAGEPIAQKWSSKVKRDIISSRVDTTERLAKIFKNSNLNSFISASATGFYGDNEDIVVNEEADSGSGFLARVCVEWERAAKKIKEESPQTRLVILRFGMVLGEGEGALAQMVPPFQNGVGGMIADGKMWVSWIHIEDLVNMITWAIENKSIEGTFNAVSPNPVTNKEFSEKLAKRFNKKLFLPVPKIAVKFLFGEMSQVVLDSQRVKNKNIEATNFKYKYPNITEALESTVDSLESFEKKVIFEQWLSVPPEKLFPYFQDEKNLEELTPPWLNFKVIDKSTGQIEKGTIINYQLKLYGVPFTWQTEILDFHKNKFFIDNQVKGPYSKWHHTHEFIPLAGGTLVRDSIRYKVPLSGLGKTVAGPKVDNDVKKIFKHRSEKIVEVSKGLS